jgi:hypothetical protein
MAEAQDALNEDRKAGRQNYKDNFQQQLDDYAASALNDSTLIDRADFNSKLAAKSAKGIASRSRSRAGVALSGQAANQANRLGGLETAKFMDQSKNASILAQDERNTRTLADSLSSYNDLEQTGSDALRNAAGLESNRIAGNKRRSADADASNMGMASSLASMMIFGI